MLRLSVVFFNLSAMLRFTVLSLSIMSNESRRSFYLIHLNPLKQEYVQSLNKWMGNFISGGMLCNSVKINEFSLLITYTCNLKQKVLKDFHDAIVSFCIFCCCVAFNRCPWSTLLLSMFLGGSSKLWRTKDFGVKKT